MAMLNPETRLFEHSLPIQHSYLGLDLSLTSTGVALLAPGVLASTRLVPGEMRGVSRLLAINAAIGLLVMGKNPVAVCLEGYALGAKSHAHSLGELGGVVKTSLAQIGIPMFVAPPNTLKKAITGDGQSKGKGPIFLALLKRFGLDMEGACDDEADAAACSVVAALVTLGLDHAMLTAKHRDGLKGVEALPPVLAPARHRPRLSPEQNRAVATRLQSA